ncbi:hypothetical protein AOLI_G00248330 [Acnodon oligacanthus]
MITWWLMPRTLRTGKPFAQSWRRSGVESRPRAEQYLFVLQPNTHCQDEAMLLLNIIFGGEKHVYTDPGALALAFWDCLEKHIQHLLSRLQAT